jgi:TolB-like protein/DNA-binding winged helix-turn-helix (wHTH) protein/Flp pilus assembly protein TadD
VFELEEGSEELSRQGLRVKLQPQPSKVLTLLVSRAPKLVTREEIFEEIWGDTVVEESNLNFCIKQIRIALGDEAETPQYIETVPKRGYRFIHHVEATSPQVQDDTSKARPPPSPKFPVLAWISLLFLVLLVMAALLNTGRIRDWWDGGVEVVETRSLAVLPFANLTGDEEQQYLVDGMTGAIINELGKIRALRVPSWTSVMTYKEHPHQRLPEIARELEVNTVVEGSVFRSGDVVRIDVQLIEGSTDTHLWAESYEGDMGNLISLQRNVALEITRRIQAAITPEERTRLVDAKRVDPRATEAYLKGRFHWNTRKNLLRSLELFEEAIAIDDEFALGYSGLADAYGLLGSTPYDFLPPTQAKPRAKEAARKALSLDVSLAEAHAALARDLLFYDWNWPEAEREFQHAIELNPGYGTARQWYAELLWLTGRMDEAEKQIQEALKRDNRSIVFHLAYGRHFYLNRDYERAVDYFKDAIEMAPGYFLGPLDLGLSYAQMGKHSEAITAMKEAVRLYDGPLCLAGLGYAYARAEKEEEARRVITRLVRLSEERYVPRLYVAGVHAALGENDAAFEWLEDAYQQRSDYILFVNIEPIFDPLRDDPRLQGLLDRLNFPAAAREIVERPHPPSIDQQSNSRNAPQNGNPTGPE